MVFKILKTKTLHFLIKKEGTQVLNREKKNQRWNKENTQKSKSLRKTLMIKNTLEMTINLLKQSQCQGKIQLIVNGGHFIRNTTTT